MVDRYQTPCFGITAKKNLNTSQYGKTLNQHRYYKDVWNSVAEEAWHSKNLRLHSYTNPQRGQLANDRLTTENLFLSTLLPQLDGYS